MRDNEACEKAKGEAYCGEADSYLCVRRCFCIFSHVLTLFFLILDSMFYVHFIFRSSPKMFASLSEPEPPCFVFSVTLLGVVL